MSLEKAIQAAQTQIPECLAIGYVDMQTGMLLGVKTVDSHPSEVLDLVAAATAEMFQGPTILTIEKHFKRVRGHAQDDIHYFQEIAVWSQNLLHVFLRGKKHTSHATVIVCRASANVGMVLAKSRMIHPTIEAAL
ncbi:MAG: hypothetical protein JNL21_31915 [Myxococcales bacterium]|nr:hypothetical protein [Myxococcales bacterium]